MASAPNYPGPNKQEGWAPGYPQPGYPAAGQQYPMQPGYPPQPGYPGAQPGYPGAQPSYPGAQAGYPGAQPGYPAGPGMQPGAQVPAFGFAPRPPMDSSAYNMSGGGSTYQPGQGGTDPKDDEDALAASGLGNSFGDKAIRHAFVRKVYLILMLQLLVTVGVIALFTFHQGVKSFVQRNMWVYLLSYGVFIVTYMTLVCCSGVRRKYPGNIIMLSIFTLAMSYMTGTIASTYDTQIVIMTVGITAVICFLISIFAMQTKYDVTGWGMYLFVAGMVMFVFGIVAIFTFSHIMRTIYSAGIALLFSMYLVYDTQMLIGGRKYELSAEEHVFGALTLYIDVVQIFIALLGLSRN